MASFEWPKNVPRVPGKWAVGSVCICQGHQDLICAGPILASIWVKYWDGSVVRTDQRMKSVVSLTGTPIDWNPCMS